jgi:HEAT repeat protein
MRTWRKRGKRTGTRLTVQVPMLAWKDENTMRRFANFTSTFLAILLAAGALLAEQSGQSAVELLKSPDAATRAKAARELGQSKDLSALHPLAAAVSDPSVKVRREVVVALSSFHAPEALDALITATRDTDPDVRVLAVHGLVGYYTGQTPSFGFVAFWQRAWRSARSRFVEENVRIDPGVRVDPRVVDALVAVMNDTRSIKPAREAADGLGILRAPKAVPDLIAAANSTDEDLALEALNSLAKIQDTAAGPKLLNLLDSPDKAIKRQAALTLGILRTPEALPELQSMYENGPDGKTREKALEGLAYLGSPVSVPLFLKVLWNSDSLVRTLAAEGLGRARDPKALPDLEKAVQVEKNADAKLAMEFAIAALGKDDYLSALAGALGSRRGDSAQTYWIELARHAQFLPKLYPYLNNNDPEVRRRLCTVLMFSGDATSLAPLERLARDPNNSVASEAMRALRAIRARTGGQASAPAAASNP